MYESMYYVGMLKEEEEMKFHQCVRCWRTFSLPAHWILLNFLFPAVQISTSTYAHLLATNSYHHYVKCVDIYPHPDPADMLLALGQANGKVVLTTFGPSAYDALGLTGLELSEYSSNVFFYQYLLR